jgi:hypothetical protein
VIRNLKAGAFRLLFHVVEWRRSSNKHCPEIVPQIVKPDYPNASGSKYRQEALPDFSCDEARSVYIH